MDAAQILDASAASALARAAELRAELSFPDGDASAVDIVAAREHTHRLIVDIVSMRNAGELLKRECRVHRS